MLDNFNRDLLLEKLENLTKKILKLDYVKDKVKIEDLEEDIINLLIDAFDEEEYND